MAAKHNPLMVGPMHIESVVQQLASAVDLSDGLGLDDLMRVAGKVFGVR